MIPAAPGLLSMTTGWPMPAASFSPTTRASTSVPPPAAKGTTILIGLVGSDWASAGAPAHRAKAEAAAARHRRRMRAWMGMVVSGWNENINGALLHEHLDLERQAPERVLQPRLQRLHSGTRRGSVDGHRERLLP